MAILVLMRLYIICLLFVCLYTIMCLYVFLLILDLWTTKSCQGWIWMAMVVKLRLERQLSFNLSLVRINLYTVYYIVRVIVMLILSLWICLEMALKNHKGTESEVVQICSRLLKYAPDRKGGGGRKENSAWTAKNEHIELLTLYIYILYFRYILIDVRCCAG
jgi:hypothetical protein